MLNRAEILKQKFNQSVGLSWRKILPEYRTEEILVDENIQYRNCVHMPIATRWAQRYSAKQLGQLYGLRWQAAEVNSQYLKATLGMEMLSAKTPQMVRKGLWAHLLAYNLLRTVMLQTAQSSKQVLSRISLQGTRQQFLQTIELLAISGQAVRERLYRVLIQIVAKDLLPLRVFRSEPRIVKRRPKPFPRMNKPRDVLKAALVN
jgi:hypothetical protein